MSQFVAVFSFYLFLTEQFFKNYTSFSKNSLSFIAKLVQRGKVQIFPIYLLTHMCTDSPIINIPHQSGTFVTTDESILTHHNQPKSIIYITVHPWHCT